MSARTHSHGRTWRRAVAVSLVLHGFLLLAIAAGAFATAARTIAGTEIPSFAAAMIDTPTWVDLSAIDILAPLDLTLSPAVASAPEIPVAPAAPPADQSRASSTPLAQPVAGGQDSRSPAPDRGQGQGRPVDQPAWRRDATTLHERLSDGAQVNQPARARIAAQAVSPQAVRRETLTGVGDSTRTRRAQHVPLSARYGVAEPRELGEGGVTTDGVPGVDSRVAVNTAVPETHLTVLASSQGPLSSEVGVTSFDVENPGVTAADNRVLREASREDHPGITDLSLAGVSGNTDQGRGPSDTPGAVARVTGGLAPSRAGARGPARGTVLDSGTEERRYDRYKQEIGAQVEKHRVFPRSLAVQLQQGETLLHFVVRPDGRLEDAIQIVKSSGFAEFDQSALEAVRKALPFRPMPNADHAKPLTVNLRVSFPNPVIR